MSSTRAAPVLMVAGTASSVGKSLLVAGLCRIFAQDGLRVAPFKAQNMSLNSYATRDGRELGRAQAMQAQAAGVEPVVEMNPILLKPEGDARSQVVAMGRPWATLKAGDYYRRRQALWQFVTGSLDTLRAQYDLVVVEGAGAAVEPNFRSSDIVNMPVARYAQAATLLAGDIDRGGVFGALLGTLELMSAEDRALIRGFIINKFRGDRALLEPALVFITERTGVPVLGVVPHLGALRIADEDSVVLERASPPTPLPKAERGDGLIDIAVIRLPHMANFDDFDALALEEGVRVRFVGSPEEMGRPDAIILPGSKTTIADLAFVNETGLAANIAARARGGCAVAGICAGYQMLGHVIRDPLHVESERDASPGLGLLPVETVFAREKATEQVQARIAAECGFLAEIAGQTITGYEIHMGRTTGFLRKTGSFSEWSNAPMRTDGEDGSYARNPAGEPAPTALLHVMQRGDERVHDADGAVDESGRIFGVYLHGIFDNPNFRRAWLNSLRPHATSAETLHAQREREYDRLADAMRAALDMGAIRAMIGR
jgi:adenosylcobyric acid synthase